MDSQAQGRGDSKLQTVLRQIRQSLAKAESLVREIEQSCEEKKTVPLSLVETLTSRLRRLRKMLHRLNSLKEFVKVLPAVSSRRT
jgi:hypothetical protein